jgi:glycogen debranching enzyme
MNQTTDHAYDEDAETITPFYIPSTAANTDLNAHVLKYNNTFAIFNRFGDIKHGSEGIYHEDTRYLSRFELTIHDAQPLLLSSAMQDDNSLLTTDLANPDLYSQDHLILTRETIHITRTLFLDDNACYERVALRNYHHRPHSTKLRIDFASDFVDLFEVRGHHRPQRGHLHTYLPDDHTVVLTYRGLDQLKRQLRIHCQPAPAQLTTRCASYELELSPHGTSSLFFYITYGIEPLKETSNNFFSSLRKIRHATRHRLSSATKVITSNQSANEVTQRAVADLYMLISQTSFGPYPYAGIPWYSTVFGRDGIITALLMLWMDPQVARGVLRFLAATQATAIDPETDAQPGKILHEIRNGEMARLGEVPFGRYYGTIDATPLFILLAARYFRRTGDRQTLLEIWHNLEAALRWVDHYGDQDGDGFVEYMRQTSQGLANQGWKDSCDAIFHANGELAHGPIALCEVQAYVYAAKHELAQVALVLDKHDMAQRLEQEAQTLQAQFETAFWCEELDFYALALDGEKQPCRVRTSNAGHALFAGIAAPERAIKIADALMRRDFFTGWGIRTVARGEARYNPMSYHNGSVWPHDNALIALGLARYGYKASLAMLCHGLFNAATYSDPHRLPELFCGFVRRRGKAPTFYPVACSPQAWASATVPALIEACLGLDCDAVENRICLDQPIMPDFVDDILLKRLTVNGTMLNLRLQRHEHQVAVSVQARQGDAKVLVVH